MFRVELEARLGDILAPHLLSTKVQLMSAVDGLTEVIQDMFRTTVPISKQLPHAKRWWNDELARLKREKNKLSSASFKYSAILDHPMHEQHREIRNSYGDTILHAKQDHWRDFLESSSYENLWIANKYISGPGSDGSKTRIPMLKLMAMESASGSPREAATNGDKSEVLARLMFPRKPQVSHVPPQFAYSPSFPIWGEITPRQIGCHITRLSPYKATGTDDIPNIVLIQSADLLMLSFCRSTE